MPKYWMITNRELEHDEDDHAVGFSGQIGELSYWIADEGRLDRFASWTPKTKDEFKVALVRAASAFPLIEDPRRNGDQKHVSVFIHGYNNRWDEAAKRYQSIVQRIFEEEDLGLCILYTWPSNGKPYEYLPDRQEADRCAGQLSEVLNELYDWALEKQVDAATDPADACRAKISILAHSMGNYVLQKAMQYTWTRKNMPLLVSLVTQLLMIAADVDNDLFQCGEVVDQSDGDAIANLCYRVTALYTGRDEVLGMSAGLKQFGKRRLGRSGLDTGVPAPDNVWDVDCTGLIPPNASSDHSAYFDSQKTIALIKQVLRGVDRNVIMSKP